MSIWDASVMTVVLLIALSAVAWVFRSRSGQVAHGHRPLAILRGKTIIDRWSVVLEDGAGAEEFLTDVIVEELTRSELPAVYWAAVDVAPNLASGLLGRRRGALRVQSRDLKDFTMYVTIASYGRHLSVSWFLTVEPALLKRLASLLLTRVFVKRGDESALSFRLDLFSEQELRVFATTVHRCCVKRAVTLLAARLGQEATHFDWRSRGFLELW